MGNLTDKFKSMGITLGGSKPPIPMPPGSPGSPERQESASNLYPRQEAKAVPIDQVVQGSYRSTIYGDIFAVESLYPLTYTHGASELNGSHSLQTITEWAKASQLANSPRDNFVFLDTETTGLAGGTGTFAFLVGVGRLTPQGFNLVQFFMRTPGEETALLAALSEWMEPFDAIVTYNGKSFDAPLLNTRYVMQGLTSPLIGAPHVDLLHLARRLWRDRLPSRSLKAVEVDILGASRGQDEVPSWMIPELYFNYLRSGDAGPLGGVFYHNAIDVVSLAALFNHTSQMLDDPLHFKDQPGLDLVALAKLFEDMGYLDKAVQLYEVGMERGLPEDFFWKTVERFAYLHKRQKEWPAAVALWQKAASHGETYAYVELAKYFEHEQRRSDLAIEWTLKAIDQLDQPQVPSYLRRQWRPDLERRLARLRAKTTRTD